MTPSPHGTAARDKIIRAQTASAGESRVLNHKGTGRIWSGVCFVIVMLAVFGHALWELVNYAAGSELCSYILLIPFVSAYLLYLRRDQLPKKSVADLSLAIVFLAVGVSVFALTSWLDFAGRAPAENDRLTLLTLSFLCCLAAG